MTKNREGSLLPGVEASILMTLVNQGYELLISNYYEGEFHTKLSLVDAKPYLFRF